MLVAPVMRLNSNFLENGNVVTSLSFTYRLSVKQEILHFDELQSELTLPFSHGSK
jgi:hypothetical protein